MNKTLEELRAKGWRYQIGDCVRPMGDHTTGPFCQFFTWVGGAPLTAYAEADSIEEAVFKAAQEARKLL